MPWPSDRAAEARRRCSACPAPEPERLNRPRRVARLRRGRAAHPAELGIAILVRDDAAVDVLAGARADDLDLLRPDRRDVNEPMHAEVLRPPGFLVEDELGRAPELRHLQRLQGRGGGHHVIHVDVDRPVHDDGARLQVRNQLRNPFACLLRSEGEAIDLVDEMRRDAGDTPNI